MARKRHMDSRDFSGSWEDQIGVRYWLTEGRSRCILSRWPAENCGQICAALVWKGWP
jgi:hypothetical protein